MKKDDLRENGDPKRTKLPADLITKAKEMHNIRYTFTQEELQAKSREMATAVTEKNHLADDLKTIKSDYKAKTDAKDAIINLMSVHISNGYEMKNVECDVIKDFEKGTKTYSFNGVNYDTVPLTALDRQTELNLINKAPASALAKHEAKDESGDDGEEGTDGEIADSPAASVADED